VLSWSGLVDGFVPSFSAFSSSIFFQISSFFCCRKRQLLLLLLVLVLRGVSLCCGMLKVFGCKHIHYACTLNCKFDCMPRCPLALFHASSSLAMSVPSYWNGFAASFGTWLRPADALDELCHIVWIFMDSLNHAPSAARQCATHTDTHTHWHTPVHNRLLALSCFLDIFRVIILRADPIACNQTAGIWQIIN